MHGRHPHVMNLIRRLFLAGSGAGAHHAERTKYRLLPTSQQPTTSDSKTMSWSVWESIYARRRARNSRICSGRNTPYSSITRYDAVASKQK
jgi:hypothetical protein